MSSKKKFTVCLCIGVVTGLMALWGMAKGEYRKGTRIGSGENARTVEELASPEVNPGQYYLLLSMFSGLSVFFVATAFVTCQLVL